VVGCSWPCSGQAVTSRIRGLARSARTPRSRRSGAGSSRTRQMRSSLRVGGRRWPRWLWSPRTSRSAIRSLRDAMTSASRVASGSRPRGRSPRHTHGAGAPSLRATQPCRVCRAAPPPTGDSLRARAGELRELARRSTSPANDGRWRVLLARAPRSVGCPCDGFGGARVGIRLPVPPCARQRKTPPYSRHAQATKGGVRENQCSPVALAADHSGRTQLAVAWLDRHGPLSHQSVAQGSAGRCKAAVRYRARQPVKE
jgi:hypothetical protein